MNEISQSLIAYGAPVLFTVVFVEQVGLPLPCVPWLLAAGALSASGEMNAAVTLGMSVVACVIADSLWFYVGRRRGNRVVQLVCRLFLVPNWVVLRTKSLFDRKGSRGLVFAKFLPGLGNVMPPLAGALGVRATHFLLFDSLGSFLYAGFYIGAGILFHNQLKQVLAVLKQLWLSTLLFALFSTAYIAFKYVRHHLVVGRTSHKTAGIPEHGR
jgi:membrane protein DedA with SNARE-associated domain